MNVVNEPLTLSQAIWLAVAALGLLFTALASLLGAYTNRGKNFTVFSPILIVSVAATILATVTLVKPTGFQWATLLSTVAPIIWLGLWSFAGKALRGT